MRQGLSQGGRWLFKKGCSGGKKKNLQRYPHRVQALLSSVAPTPSIPPAPPVPVLPQPDFGREQNPKCPGRSPPPPPPPPRPRTGKVKIWGQGAATCHPGPPQGLGTRARLPRPADAAHPRSSLRRAAPRDPDHPPTRRPRGARFAEVWGDFAKTDVCRERSVWRGVPAELTASLRVGRSHLESGHQAHRRRRRLRAARGCPAECPPVGPGSGSRRGRGGAGAPRGGGGEAGEGGAGALRKGPPGRGAPSFSRFPANY